MKKNFEYCSLDLRSDSASRLQLFPVQPWLFRRSRSKTIVWLTPIKVHVAYTTEKNTMQSKEVV